MKLRNYISLSAVFILIYVLVRVAFLYPRWENTGAEATLSWDVFGYYLYLPAKFIYNDLGGLGFVDEIFSTYRPAADFYHAVEQPDGQFVMKYPIGMAILYFPFFLLGHLIALWTDYPADGFSWPYQFAISIGAIVYAVTGLFILRRIMLKYFSDLTTALVLSIIVLATNYLNYVSFDGAMPHGPLFTLYALVLLMTVKWHEQPDWRFAAGLGLSIGLATIVRPTELMLVLIPLLWGVHNKTTAAEKLRSLWTSKVHVVSLGAGIVLMGLIQMIYWKIYSGHFLYYSYEEYTFDWFRPHIWSGLFSFRKGWLVYTPVMVMALIGLIPLYRNHREKFWTVAIYLGLTIYIVFAWQVWWYGGSFGSRPMVQLYALLALPLGACITYVLKRKILTVIMAVFVLFCVDLNMIMSWQAHARDGGWEAEYMTKAYFWKIFGSSRPDKADKIFLDVRHELKNTDGMTIRALYENDYETDTVAHTTDRFAYEGQKSLLLDAGHPYSPRFEISMQDLSPKEKSWIRTGARVFYTQMQWDRWQQAQLITEFVRDDKPYRLTAARIQRTTDPWQWHDFVYEMKIPEDYQPTDNLRVYLWNVESQTEVFVDNLKVELIEPED